MYENAILFSTRIMIGRKTLCLLMFSCFTSKCCVSSEEAIKPNIIFALADDLGWNDVQYNGGKALTPNLDEMSRSSGTVRLLRHYSGSPVCSPTRGTVLTGRNHNRYCVWSYNKYSVGKGDFKTVQTMPLPQTEMTVAEVLKNFNYSTACFGKWHLGNFKPVADQHTVVSHPGLHGFDQWWATEANAPTSYPNCGCGFNVSRIEDVRRNRNCRKGCVNYHSSNASGNIISWPDAIIGEDALFIWERAEEFIREQVKSEKPFFLYLPFHNIHTPIVTTSNYTSQYHSLDNIKLINRYGSISALDDTIGRLRNLLKELNISNNTIFWFTSDNGPASIENKLRGHKTRYYEGGIRVPGLIEWPNVIHENRESNFPVVTNDFLPTVYDILGTEPGNGRSLDGISLLPFLEGRSNERRNKITWGRTYKNRRTEWKTIAIADNTTSYKLIAHYGNKNKIKKYQLFDLDKDIKEEEDLSLYNRTEYKSISQNLMNDIEAWQLSVTESIKKNCFK